MIASVAVQLSDVSTDAHALATLIAGCQRGERSAQSAFYRTYRPVVLRTLHKVMGQHQDIEDAVQDVFIEVFRSISKFRAEAKLTTWLYRVCVNVALQRLRKHRRRPEGYAVAIEDHEQITDATPQSKLEQKDAEKIVYGVLDTMAPKKRAVFVLHEIMGMDASEIATVVDTNVLTVRTRLHYARKEFYQKVAQGGHKLSPPQDGSIDA